MIVRRKQKIFFLDEAGNSITGAELKARQAANGGSLKSNLENLKLDNAIKTEQQTATRAAERVANKANANGVANAAKRARVQGFNAGKASTGIMQGAKNTWAGMGKMGKAGAIAGGLAATGLMAKGLFGGKKD